MAAVDTEKILTIAYYFVLFVTARIAAGAIGGFFRAFLRPGKKLTKYGKWAVVTGATDGIGKAMCIEFARQRMNVLVISRTKSKLEDMVDLLEKFRVEADYLVVDFSNFDDAAREAVRAKIAELDVGVLVNNVGLSYPFPQYFMEISDEYTQNLIDLNVISTTFMTRLALPSMIERKRGAIVNISSASARGPMPLLAGYSATKSYIELFSEALHHEYKAKGVDVQCQTPLFVTTKLSKIRKSSFFVCTPKAYAKAALKNIGYEAILTPYWTHKLQLSILESVPRWAVASYMWMLHGSLRKRGLKKQQEKEGGSKKSQ